jgi:hypothetical protein
MPQPIRSRAGRVDEEAHKTNTASLMVRRSLRSNWIDKKHEQNPSDRLIVTKTN